MLAKRTTGALVALGLLSGIIWGTAVATRTNAAGTTQGSVSFIDDAGATAPVNPTNPSETIPADPNNPATGNTGTLTLDVAPAKFNFGSVTTSFAAKDYYPTDNYNQYLQISDKRTDANGWQVMVKQNRTLTNDVNNYVLTGATITIPQGTARNSLGSPATAPDSKITVANAVTISNADQPVVTAANQAGTGKATTTNTWHADGVRLRVPAMTAKPGNYTNSIIWSLVATVTN